MVMKNDEKKGKSEFVAAQSSRHPILKKTSQKMDAEENEFSDDKTGHGKPETGNKEIEIGPAEKASVSCFEFPVSGNKTQDHKNKTGDAFEHPQQP